MLSRPEEAKDQLFPQGPMDLQHGCEAWSSEEAFFTPSIMSKRLPKYPFKYELIVVLQAAWSLQQNHSKRGQKVWLGKGTWALRRNGIGTTAVQQSEIKPGHWIGRSYSASLCRLLLLCGFLLIYMGGLTPIATYHTVWFFNRHRHNWEQTELRCNHVIKRPRNFLKEVFFDCPCLCLRWQALVIWCTAHGLVLFMTYLLRLCFTSAVAP